MPTFAETQKGYKALWDKAALTSSKRASALVVARRIIANRKRYEAVEAKTGVPWYWIGAIHDRECSGSFSGVLHNGEHIIGKGTKTKLVPAGRGPFSSWEQAAIDALQIKGLHKLTDWSDIARQLYEAERFNGMGYFGRGVNSPYVWAATSLQQPGKYIRDHVWSSTAWDEQLGVVAVLKALLEADPNSMKPAKPSVLPPVVVTAGASSLTALLGLLGSSPLLWGAVLAVVVLLVYELRKYPMLKTILGSLLANKVTSSAGTLGLIGAIADIATQFATKSFDADRLLTDFAVIATALGLLGASDAKPKAA